MLAAGTKLGPYEILGPLGAGGMGEVYRARDTRLGRDVAVKVLPAHLAATPELRARFEREARAVSALNYPHICTLHDVGREGDTDFLVMEHLEGETLAARLERGPLPTEPLLKTEMRRVPLSPELLAELRLRVGRLLSIHDSSGFTRQVRNHSGVERFHPHQMRHTFACRWLEEGRSLEALQHVLGHATIAMTQRYGRLSDEHVRREAERDTGKVASDLASNRR